MRDKYIHMQVSFMVGLYQSQQCFPFGLNVFNHWAFKIKKNPCTIGNSVASGEGSPPGGLPCGPRARTAVRSTRGPLKCQDSEGDPEAAQLRPSLPQPHLGHSYLRLCASFSFKVGPSCQGLLRLCDPLDCSPPASSVHGILQARMLEWIAIFFCSRSS